MGTIDGDLSLPHRLGRLLATEPIDFSPQPAQFQLIAAFVTLAAGAEFVAWPWA